MRAIGKAPGGNKTNWLTAVVLYDDAQLAHAASSKCREIEQNVEHAKIYALRTINLNTLQGSPNSKMAITETASADLVFICLNPDHELSRWTQLWMREWASNRTNHHGALIHFSHQDHITDWKTSLVREFLEHISELGSLDLIEVSASESMTPELELPFLN